MKTKQIPPVSTFSSKNLTMRGILITHFTPRNILARKDDKPRDINITQHCI